MDRAATDGNGDPRPATDADVGKRIEIEFRYLDATGRVTRRSQHLGVVEEVAEAAMTVRWDGGRASKLPPVVADNRPAMGEMRLAGGEVEEPELVAGWELEKVGED